MREILGKVKNRVLDAMFPATCMGCGKEGRYVCERCTLFLVEAEPVCPRCSLGSITGIIHPHCQKGEGLDGVVSCWEHEGLMKTMLHTIRGGVTHAIPDTVDLAFQQLLRARERYVPFFHTLLSKESAITFVPLFPRRERRQGFNQAALIAQAVGQIGKKQVLPLLKKLHDISLRGEWDTEKRRQVLQDTFVLEETVRGILPSEVVLVDDLWQSGATLNEAAALLKRAGVEKVWGFTLAKAV